MVACMKGLNILCAGGGTAGSMIPLTVLCQWRNCSLSVGERDRVSWVGTGSALEQKYYPMGVINKHFILTAKLHRYWHWKNALLPFTLIRAFVQALGICRKVKPNVIWTAGGFVAVPVAWAGWMLGVPILTIQQDVERGLANRLMEPLARQRAITIPPEAVPSLPYSPKEWIGSLTRFSLPRQRQPTSSVPDRPLVLILGGSSGAQSLNTLIWQMLPLLKGEFDIVHSVGLATPVPPKLPQWYRAIPTINADDLGQWYAKATVVIARAGMNTVSECAYFSKPLVILPLPKTHQEVNAQWLAKHQAVILVSQWDIHPDDFASQITNLIHSPDSRRSLGATLHTLLPSATAERVAPFIDLETNVL